MPTIILDNGKVAVETMRAGNKHLSYHIRYAPAVREDVFNAFSNVLTRSSLPNYAVNRGDIRDFLIRVHPLVSRRFVDTRDSRGYFRNVLGINLHYRDSVNFGDDDKTSLVLAFAVNGTAVLYDEIALDPTLTYREMAGLMDGLKRAFDSLGSYNTFKK